MRHECVECDWTFAIRFVEMVDDETFDIGIASYTFAMVTVDDASDDCLCVTSDGLTVEKTVGVV